MEDRNFYMPADLEGLNYETDLGNPGEYPFVRGVHPNMYRGKLWTMRQFAGFGSAKDTNKRFKHLLRQGQTGLSVAFHLPTLMGYDSDHPLSQGEVGRDGVAVDSLLDFETLFKGIPLDKITTSMTINATAIVALAMYVALAEKQGISQDKIGGTIQNDILKEYIAQNTFIFPPEPSLRIIVDIFEYCSKYIPNWNTISVSGYHIREAGATAAQELAFTLADGMTYIEAGVEKGLDVDSFAPRISFFFNLHNNLFEEIAKIRAARRIWAKTMRERFGAKNPKSWLMRCHAQTAGCALTAQQPLNNIARVSLQALAGVLAGVQSLHTNSYDEALCLPTEKAVTIALRTQQIIAAESEVTEISDPLGGSYYLEALTCQMEKEADEYFKKIKAIGGMVKAIRSGFPQSEIRRAAYEYQTAMEKEKKIVIGVNKYVTDFPKCQLLKIKPETETRQVERLLQLKQTRDNQKVAAALAEIKRTALSKENLFPPVLTAVKSYATVGEIADALREVFGEYKAGF